MQKLIFFVFLVFSTCGVFAEDLRLQAEKNRLGLVIVYVENTGDSPHTILTSNLGATSSGTEVVLSPIKHVWIRDGKKLILKESITSYDPVTINPGEITYISSPSIKPETTKITYEIEESWALTYGIWKGNIETNL